MTTLKGNISKLQHEIGNPIQYYLPIGEDRLHINDYIGQKISISFEGMINCVHCGKKTKKSFSQGYCYSCFIKLAACDRCIMNPELCHFHLGTCREPEWGKEHCFIPHTIYLANSSGIKVGITRSFQETTRWVDQGATQALPIGRVENRYDSGKVEVLLKKHVSDKTNWRKMLRGEAEKIDLKAEKEKLLAYWPEEIKNFAKIEEIVHTFHYPVEKYPEKVNSHNLEKKPFLEGILMGIKGQYLIFDKTVINVRKYTGYCLTVQF